MKSLPHGKLAIAGTSLFLAACGAPGPQAPTAASACNTAAQQFAVPGVRITEAEAVAADTVRPAGQATGPLLAAHCRLQGRMNERVGVDGKPYHIGFELRLPANWNGRFLYQGGGGNDGIIRPAVGPQAAPGYALNRGFAVVTTDAGHQGPTADFGFDPVARVDNAYNAHDRVAVTAKDLIRRWYGKPADRSYFIGCSGGGRQAMMFTQRFPSYFDGVIAMAPAMRVSRGATIAAAWDTQALAAIAPAGAEGKPVLANALTDADLGLVRNAILQSCDAQDGLADGLVSHPAACKFDVKSLQCTGAKNATCLSQPQVNALQKMFAGPVDSAGRKLYFSWPWDPGMGHAANDWRNWKLGTSQTAVANSRHVFLMQDALQGYFVTPPDRSLSIFAFDFDRDPARMDAHDWMFDTDKDVDLAGFRARNGKLLFAHGMADPIFSPHEAIDYYERLRARHGAATADFSRLFLIPGMGHCSGGAATDSWDGLGALVDWVEKGQAPQRIVATGTSVFPGRSRPLCPYPQYAHYNGSGNPEDAANFSCRNP
ncbi:tannase/feruloyl esterase family alpha/beta hydrolase [Ramlibacter sp. USB13]|uniref:Tannase/feruloyl esterase family alpha/beta hydrolase n=1 Tax=Ramlibacter cellulosilyticus TaxID=2764187 RepID=A0A923SD56_9BURK|nr:tannase/feruloyl esterase family alpha/beta hydrolase [Ramlibacter cellulosilyticus]MBC5785681.1 tannase/feruloyl esterase family alpha/beta hydrolase [Ramlibacter cellulosilyticus]